MDEKQLDEYLEKRSWLTSHSYWKRVLGTFGYVLLASIIINLILGFLAALVGGGGGNLF